MINRKRYNIPAIFKPRLKAEAKALNIGIEKLVGNLIANAGIAVERYGAHLTKGMIAIYDDVLSKHCGIAFKRNYDPPGMMLTCTKCNQYFKPTYCQRSRSRNGKKALCIKCFQRGGNK